MIGTRARSVSRREEGVYITYGAGVESFLIGVNDLVLDMYTPVQVIVL